MGDLGVRGPADCRCDCRQTVAATAESHSGKFGPGVQESGRAGGGRPRRGPPAPSSSSALRALLEQSAILGVGVGVKTNQSL